MMHSQRQGARKHLRNSIRDQQKINTFDIATQSQYHVVASDVANSDRYCLLPSISISLESTYSITRFVRQTHLHLTHQIHICRGSVAHRELPYEIDVNSARPAYNPVEGWRQQRHSLQPPQPQPVYHKSLFHALQLSSAHNVNGTSVPPTTHKNYCRRSALQSVR